MLGCVGLRVWICNYPLLQLSSSFDVVGIPADYLFLPQHALRLIAFRKAHLVLGVEPLPPPGMSWKRDAAERADGGEAEEPEAKRARVAEPQKD